MADQIDDALSTFSLSTTINNEKSEENQTPTENDSLQEQPISDRTPEASSSSKANTSDNDSVQVVFGPGQQCVLVSSLTGWRATFAKDSILKKEIQGQNRIVTNYAITSTGDELVLFYGAIDKVPGWKWRASASLNAPTYQSLKSWLSQLLIKHPQDFKHTRVVFGTGASYYAACREQYIWHDLPQGLLAAIEQYRQAIEIARAVKAERDADPNPNPDSPRILTKADLAVIPGPLPFGPSTFNLDNLPSTWLPRCVALGVKDWYAATWPEVVAVKLPQEHMLYQQLIKKEHQVYRVKALSLSIFNKDHYMMLMDDWSYRWKFAVGMIDVPAGIKEHVQTWVKLKPGRFVVWELLDLTAGTVTGMERLDENTSFVAGIESEKENRKTKEKGKKKKEEEEKQDKPARRLSRLFGRSGKEAKTPIS